MATIIPPFEKIFLFKVPPEPGELHLLKFLDSNLDDSFEVYFNPFMNGDRPDIIVMKKGQGVLVIEVKDYDLNKYQLNQYRTWELKKNNQSIKSPIDQALKYKDNLFNLHIENLLELKILDIKSFNMVSCAVYFHNASSNAINKLLVTPYKDNRKYMDFLRYNIDLIGNDNLNALDFNKILKNRYLVSNYPSKYFNDDIYASFKRFLKPPIHLKEQGKEINYSRKQLEIIYDSAKKQQRIKGVVGSGKTTVLAARAVQAHIRSDGGKVLILTYNITLKNYIHDKISEVRENFPWDCFVISNYHLFINSELNNVGIDVKAPSNFDKWSEEEKSTYFEKEYYSNKKLFEDLKTELYQYDVILIDEIQDYKRVWMEIIKEYFLTPNGEYVLFGDVKQNIYNNTTESKDISTNVRGVTELKNCFRSDYKIKDLAIHYQQEVFKDKYEIDAFNSKSQTTMDFEETKQGSINYIHLEKADSVSSLYTIIHENAINRNIPPNDITILGHSISLLKKFEAYYRYSSNEKTNTMFETYEMVYRMSFRFIKKDPPEWFSEAIKLVKTDKKVFEAKAFNRISILFTLYDLYEKYENQFTEKLQIHCSNFNVKVNDFIEYRKTYKKEIQEFKKDNILINQNRDLKRIRDNKKLHFYFNSGTVKISTVHSFKGWESDTLFLIIEKKFSQMEMTFDEILYTGITRSRSNLVIINFGNKEYHTKLKELIEKVK